MRRSRSSSRSGASGCFFLRMYSVMNAIAQKYATMEAAAAPVTPSSGRPAHPLMNAGVITAATAVERSNAYSGVIVSLTPRMSCVNRMNTSSTGMANIIMRA